MPAITSCATSGFCNYPLEAACRSIAARGFKSVDIVHLGFYCRHLDLDVVDLGQVRRMLAEHGLRPFGMNYSTSWLVGSFPELARLNDPASVPEFEHKVKRALAAAQSLGVKVVNTPIGRRRTELPDPLDELKAAAAVFSRLADEAQGLGVHLAIEAPHVYQLDYNIERMAEFLSYVTSDNLGVVLDSSHWRLIRYDLDAYLRIVGNRLCHIHLRDAVGVDDGSLDQKLEFTAGRGEVNFALLARKLDAVGYRGGVTLEFEYRDLSLSQIEAEYDYGIRHLRSCGWSFADSVRPV